MSMHFGTMKTTERGLAGHFICGDRCTFHRNTLIEHEEIKIVVSTVGAMIDYHANGFPNKISFCEIGHNRYYETMAFHADATDTRFQDMDVSRPVEFASDWCIDHPDADDEANQMHDTVVHEISELLYAGKLT